MFCINCGNKLPEDAGFCNQCGTKVAVIECVNDMPATTMKFVQPTKEIEENYKRGKECLAAYLYETAFNYFQKAAQQGHAEAQYELAEMYQDGLGVSESEKHATKWYGLAAEQGHAEAQYNLALQYMEGEDTGVEHDLVTAIKWLQLSAQQGCAGANRVLGGLYEKGEGVSQDICKAKEFYTKAVEKDDILSRVKLAALRLHEQAAEQNLLNAIMDFFNKVIPLFEDLQDIRDIHMVNISKNFDKKLQGALTYAQLENGEIPLIIMDSTIFGNAKAGALFTTNALYIKNNKPEKLFYEDINSLSFLLERELHWITINGKKIGNFIHKPQNIVLLKYILQELTEFLATRHKTYKK